MQCEPESQLGTNNCNKNIFCRVLNLAVQNFYIINHDYRLKGHMFIQICLLKAYSYTPRLLETEGSFLSWLTARMTRFILN